MGVHLYKPLIKEQCCEYFFRHFVYKKLFLMNAADHYQFYRLSYLPNAAAMEPLQLE
jgi:hypothetical protein